MEMLGIMDTRQSAPDPDGGSSASKARRNRLRLNCGECRSKKVSCDRKLPCQRCIRSGKPQLCSFGPGTRRPSPGAAANVESAQTLSENNAEQIRELREEVAQLKALLQVTGGSAQVGEPEQARQQDQTQQLTPSSPVGDASHGGIADLIDRSPRVYYQQHTLMRFTYEMPQLFPLIKEMVHESIRPRGATIKKPKPAQAHQEHDAMHMLLPPRTDVDALVSFYLDHLECIHHILHIPTFWSEYTHFWNAPRDSATAALILAMISISTVCVTAVAAESVHSVALTYQSMPPRWIYPCERWLRQQSSKCCRIPYYQVSCLLYLAKRMNLIRKKKFWNETGALMQQAVLDGLHHAPLETDSLYTKQLKSRIWTTLRELDLQNATEYGLPVLSHVLETDIPVPANLDDDDFDSSSRHLPVKLPSQFTRSSYQAFSARSWDLRVEISRRLFGTGAAKTLPYDQVLKYTSDINQALDSLPDWTARDNQTLLVSAYLSFSLREFVIALHRPHLQPGNAHASLSGTICYHAARDILLLNMDLAARGIQSLTLVREDLLVAALTVTRIALQHPRSHTRKITSDPDAALALLEACLPFVEDRYLRSYYGEPWAPIIVLGTVMLLKVHLGRETRASAKRAGAQRFLGLYYQHPAQQALTVVERQEDVVTEGMGVEGLDWDADGDTDGDYWVPPWY